MGHVLRGHIHLSMWEKSVLPEIEKSVAKLNDLDNRNNDRERRHAHALEQWVSGDWDGARGTLDQLLTEYPRDLLALQIGHLSDFFQGDRENLRGRVARAMPSWTRNDSGYGFLLGMHAFGLEECGSYAVAEEAGRHALGLEPDDCWAQHALAHGMEMQGRPAEGGPKENSLPAQTSPDPRPAETDEDSLGLQSVVPVASVLLPIPQTPRPPPP